MPAMKPKGRKSLPDNHNKANLRILAGNLSKNPLLEVDPSFQTFENESISVEITCLHSADLSDDQLTWITDLTELTMKELYEQSEGGWNRKQKEKEFKHKTARFLIVKEKNQSSGDNAKKPLAFVHFRFEMDDENKYPIVYCYEIQMPSQVQGKGLGRHLMSTLDAIGTRFLMNKVMITCFKHNSQAVAFYKKLGYELDVCSPSLCGEEKDYEIMSLKVAKLEPTKSKDAVNKSKDKFNNKSKSKQVKAKSSSSSNPIADDKEQTLPLVPQQDLEAMKLV